MKKAIIKLSALATIGLVMASCSNEEANKKAAEADNAAIQTLVDSKTAAIDAEVSAACDAKVTEAAQAVVDSLANAKPGTVVKKVTTAPVKKSTTPAKSASTQKQDDELSGKKTKTVTKTDTKNQDSELSGNGPAKKVVTKEQTKKIGRAHV